METKKCSYCKVEKPVEYFGKHKAKKDGYQSVCKECNKVIQRNHYGQNKELYASRKKSRREELRGWWKEYKRGLKCTSCGENHPATLDFHHLDGSEKEFNVSRMIGELSKESILVEVEKCVVLCSNCHRKEHYTEDD
jgi:hypothetical protein